MPSIDRSAFLEGVLVPRAWAHLTWGEPDPVGSLLAIVNPADHPQLDRMWRHLIGTVDLTVTTNWRCLLAPEPLIVFDVAFALPRCSFGIKFPPVATSRAVTAVQAGAELVVIADDGLQAIHRCDWAAARNASFGVPTPDDHSPLARAREWVAHRPRPPKARTRGGHPARRHRQGHAHGHRRARRSS